MQRFNVSGLKNGFKTNGYVTTAVERQANLVTFKSVGARNSNYDDDAQTKIYAGDS